MPPLPSFDYYAELLVDSKATQAQITSAYRRLALIHHPDRNPNDPAAATAKFQRVGSLSRLSLLFTSLTFIHSSLTSLPSLLSSLFSSLFTSLRSSTLPLSPIPRPSLFSSPLFAVQYCVATLFHVSPPLSPVKTRDPRLTYFFRFRKPTSTSIIPSSVPPTTVLGILHLPPPQPTIITTITMIEALAISPPSAAGRRSSTHSMSIPTSSQAPALAARQEDSTRVELTVMRDTVTLGLRVVCPVSSPQSVFFFPARQQLRGSGMADSM